MGDRSTTTSHDDPLGQLTNVVYPVSPALTLQYDALGRLTNLVDGLGQPRYNYAHNWLASEDGPWAEDTVSYSYQQAGPRSGLALIQPNASPWTQSYGYDPAERLTSVASPAGTFGYAYDSTRVALPGTLTLPNEATIATSYDFMARLTNTTLRSSQSAVLNHHGYGYNAASQRTSVTNMAGNRVAYTYDRSGQLVQASGKEAAGTTRLNEQFRYAYDAAGNLALRTNNFAAAEPLVQTFSITNALNQLTGVTRSGTLTVAGGTTATATSVTVKDNSNSPAAATLYGDKTFARSGVSLLDGTNTFTAVAQDSYGRGDTNAVTLNLPASVSYTYDDNGNLVSDGQMTFEYDGENQLVAVQVAGSWRSEFRYDGKLRRRVRVEKLWQNSQWVTASETRYIYDGMLVIQERDENNLPAVSYTRGSDLSGTREGVGGIGGLLARTDNRLLIAGDPSAHACYHADGNGNITALANSTLGIVARYLYDPYGNLLAKAGSLADANLYRFSSKELHPSSALYYYGYRFYAPNLQRWITRDPISEKGGMNLYRFVHNRPASVVDPDGRSLWFGSPLERLIDTVQTATMACLPRIFAEVDADHTKPNAPKRHPDDTFYMEAHCVANCRIKRECPGGGLTAWAASKVKEMMYDKWGHFKNDPWEWGDEPDSPPDYDANQVGRSLAKCKKKSCEELCREALPALISKWKDWEPGTPLP